MKKMLLSLCYMIALFSALSAQDIEGFWKSISEKTGKAQSLVAIYEYQGKYYGRIVATYDGNGKIDETMYDPKDRAPGVKGHPFYCGLDLIWNLHPHGDRYKGKIIDPQKGRVYNAELWVRQDGNLVVRGEILFFGRNQEWLPTTQKDFPSYFKKPDITKFVPVIPEVDDS